MNRLPKIFVTVGAILLMVVFVSLRQSQASIFDGTKEGTQAYGVCLDAPDPVKDPVASQKFLAEHKECAGINCEDSVNAGKAVCISETEAGTGLAKTSLTGTGITHTDNAIDYIKKLVNFALPYLALAAFLAYVVAGFMYVTAFGSDEMIGKAKKILIWTSIGLILVLLSYAITNLLTGELVQSLNPQP